MGTMGTVPQPQLQPQQKQINIHKGNPSGVDQDPVEVSKSNKDKVQWSLGAPGAGPADWLVVFDSPSPFERDYFTPEHPGNADIVVQPSNHDYKYTVYVDGKKGDDPIIRVKP